jgi:hypothetical protein
VWHGGEKSAQLVFGFSVSNDVNFLIAHDDDDVWSNEYFSQWERSGVESSARGLENERGQMVVGEKKKARVESDEQQRNMGG